MKANYILGALCLMASTVASAADFGSKPRLAVVITIDGMQSEHLGILWNSFEKGGLKRIIAEGAYAPSVACNYLPAGDAVDNCVLMTGTYPYYNGVIANKYYNPIEDEPIPTFQDPSYSGICSDLSLSAKNIKSTTIGDELKLNSQNKSKVYAVTLNYNSAITLGGHLADGAIWIDNSTGKLATTNYYENGLPAWADKINISYTIDSYMRAIWEPKFPIQTYQFAPISEKRFDQRYIFHRPNETKSREEEVRQFKRTPNANTLIRELAIRALRDEAMGQDNYTDLLSIEFNVHVPMNNYGIMCAEKEDIYLRLDREIAQLLDALDISVGAESYVIVLTAPQSESYPPQLLQKKQIETGVFNSKRAMALMNSYLMAIYGQGRWIAGYYAQNIYLNKPLIERNNIKQQEIENYVSQFITEFQGVHSAYSAHELRAISGQSNDMIMKIRNSYYIKRSGDVQFFLLPGWVETDDNNQPISVSGRINATVPFAIYGKSITPQSLRTHIDLIDIAPTLCNLLQIPPPNASTGQTIKELLQ